MVRTGSERLFGPDEPERRRRYAADVCAEVHCQIKAAAPTAGGAETEGSGKVVVIAVTQFRRESARNACKGDAVAL